MRDCTYKTRCLNYDATTGICEGEEIKLCPFYKEYDKHDK